jgi:hypothetical protein
VRRYAVGVVTLAALAGFGATSLAQSRPQATVSATTIPFSNTARMVVFSACPGHPRPHKLPCKVVAVGFQSDGTVEVDRNTIGSHPSPNVYTYSGTGVAYAGTGSLNSRWTGRYTLRANGTKVDYAVGSITGGLGTINGVDASRLRGTFTTTGSNPLGGRISTYVNRGTLVLR